jgi:hypothetical protein
VRASKSASGRGGGLDGPAAKVPLLPPGQVHEGLPEQKQ